MNNQVTHPSQRPTAIFLLSLLLLQSCYQGPLIPAQLPKLENNQKSETYSSSGETKSDEPDDLVVVNDLSWNQPEGTAVILEEIAPNIQAWVLATEPTGLPSQALTTVTDKPTFTTATRLDHQSLIIQPTSPSLPLTQTNLLSNPPQAKQTKSHEPTTSIPVREHYLAHSQTVAQNRTKIEHSVPTLITNTSGLPLNIQATANQIGSSRNPSKLKRTPARDQELAHRQKRAAQNRANLEHQLSAIKNQAHVLNTPLNWKSREGHILLELYIAQGLLRAKVADKASPELTDDLPVTVFPGISLGELASYPAIKVQQYLHIQMGKTPPLGQVIVSRGGLSGGGKNDRASEGSEDEEDLEKKEKEEIEMAEKPVGIATGSLPPMALTTLWHMGQTLGEEHYLTTALYRLEEKANQGDGMAGYQLIKKLSSLGNLAEFQAKQVKVLPISWQNKTADELQKIVTPYYANAIVQLSTAQSELPKSEQVATTLRMLKLNYHYYQLLGSGEPSSKGLLVSLNKELDQLTLQKMSASLNLKRVYLSYLVKTAGQLDLQTNAEDLPRYIEYINDQIAQKAKDALKIEKNKGERESLRRLAARHYRDLGDLSARFAQHRSSNIGKSDEWQHSYYLQASKLQDPVGTYRLGLLYEKNEGLHQNEHKARQAFEGSAQEGYCLAEHKLALYHEKEGNNELARAWHERAAKQGHPESLYALYKFDSQRSLLSQESSYLAQAAQAGHRDAQYALGKYYWEQGKYPEAIKWHHEAACQGIQESCAYLGLASAKGLGTKQDLKVALDYYLRAEKLGDNAMARYGRARLYEKGKGVARNLETALNLYTEASLLDHAQAAYHAGRLHLVGTLSGSESKQAHQFLEQAAKGGIYKASLLLGRMHEYGWGGQVDLGLALDCYKQAASDLNKDRYTRAQGLYQLGWLYRLGKGVDTDEQAALGYFEQAAIVGEDKYVQLQAGNEGLVKQLQGFQEKLDQSAAVIAEKEGAYEKLQEKSKTQLAQQEENLKKQLQEEKLAQEAAYKKLQEESKDKLAQQEANFKKQQEERLAQETKRIGEVIQKVAGNQEKLDEAIKVLVPHGEAIVKALANNRTNFQPGGDAFTETDMAVLVNHPRFKQLIVINLYSKKLSDANPSLKILAPHLKGLTNLKELYLHCNKIGDVGAKGLAQHLQEVKGKIIYLGGNSISTETQNQLKQQCPGITWYF